MAATSRLAKIADKWGNAPARIANTVRSLKIISAIQRLKNWHAPCNAMRIAGEMARTAQGVATMIRTETLRQHVAALFGALLVSTLLLSVAAPVVPIA